MNSRENLLTQALIMFTARGYEAVGVQEIAEAAGVKKPTLYHFFGSKNGLLTTLLTKHLDPFMETLQQAALYQHDITKSLQTVAATYFNFAGQNPRFYRFFLSLWFASAESDAFKAALPFNTRQQEFIETMFLAASNDHGNMKGRHKAYAASFLGMVNTYVMLSLNGYAESNDGLIASTVKQFMHGIFS